MIKLQQILGIFEHDFVKVKNQAAQYEEWKNTLIQDVVHAKQEGEELDIEFWKDFEYPVHPQVAIDLIAAFRI